MKKALLLLALVAALPAVAQTVGSNGSLSYGYTFSVPPARGRYQPALALSYSPDGGKGEYGVGWSLSVGYLEADQRATLNTDGSIRTRIFLVDGGSRRLLALAADGTYRADVASAYLTFKQVGSSSTSSGYWSASDGAGTQYTYSCIGGFLCARWYLTSAVDVDGNQTNYSYDSNMASQACPASAGAANALLLNIAYNIGSGNTPTHQVALNYGPSSGSTTGAAAGCLVTHVRELLGVTVTRLGVTLASWSLSYTKSADTSRDLLTSIQAKDRVGSAIGIPTSFTYEKNNLGPGSTPTFFGPATAFTKFSSPQPLTAAQSFEWGQPTSPGDAVYAAAWVDLDGDGLPDLVWGGADTGVCPGCPSPPSPAPTPGLRWAHNRGGLTFDPPVMIPGSQNWQGIVNSTYYVRKNIFTVPPPGPGGVGYSSGLGSSMGFTTSRGAAHNATLTNTLLIDFNGDGYPDLVTGGAALPYDGSPCLVTDITVRFSQADASGLRSFGPPTCVDATGPQTKFKQLYESSTYMPLEYTRTDYIPSYYEPCCIEPNPQDAVQYTWVKLADMNGDGILDYVVADCGPSRPTCAGQYGSTPTAGLASDAGWLVYPGYWDKTKGWSFRATPYQMHPTGTIDVMSAVKGVSPVPTLYPINESSGNLAMMQLVDFNGDGLPDHVVSSTGSLYYVAKTGVLVSTASSTTIDYNAGMGAGSQDFIASASFSAWGGTDFGDGAATLQDVNGDGRPDYLQFFSANVSFSLNNGATFVASASYTQPTGVSPRNFIDIDGDGIADIVNDQTFYKGHSMANRSDILTNITAASGAQCAIKWGPATDYGVFSASGGPSSYAVSPGVRASAPVVESLTVSGPAMDPLTTSYVYSTPVFVQPWDDPTGSQREQVGYFERYDVPSVGKGVQHSQYGSASVVAGLLMASYPTAGEAILSETGSLTNGFTPLQVPAFSVISKSMVTWATQPIACTTSCPAYPVYLYASEQDQYKPDLGPGAVSTVTNSAPDAYGHVLSSKIVADTLSASSNTVVVTRAYGAVANSLCIDCLLEEKTTDSFGTTELAHRYLHYDSDTSPSVAATTRGQITRGHMTYVEYLVGTGVYEIPSVKFYDTSSGVTAGLPTREVRTYTGQQISTLTQNFFYDSASTGTELIQTRTDSDTTASVLTDYIYDAYGEIVEQHGPYLAGATTYPILAKAYDSVGRVSAEAQSPVISGAVTMPLRAYTYTTPTTTLPGAIATFQFVRGSSQSLSYPIGSVPQTDDATLSVRYFDGLGRTVQVRGRLGSGTSGSSGNVLTHLPSMFVVSSNVILDGLGRTVVSFDPYFASSSAFADPRTSTELQALGGLHATSFAYDGRSRPICQMFAPAPNGAYVAAPTTSSQCVSNPVESSFYRRAAWTSYGVDGTLDGRNYLAVDVTPDWAAQGSTPARRYLDSTGRPRYSRTPSGTYEQTMYDLLGRRTAAIRTAGSPAAATASVTSSWAYDKRGRVTSEFADAAGTKYYSYLPTGELVQTIQNATSTANKNAVWSTLIIGTFGRVVERDDSRWTLQVVDNCQQNTPVTDKTNFQYDNAYLGNTSRYGASSAGLLTVAFTSASTQAFGFDPQQTPQVRDEWTPDGAQHTASELFGVDGRLLQRTITSPSLTSYSPAGTIGYAVGYDSAGRPAQVIGPYQPSSFASTLIPYVITAVPASSVLWSAGSGSDPTTGPYDALGRLANERWDAGAIAKGRSFLPGSNLLGSDATTGASSTNIYTTQYTSWQAGLVGAYTVSSSQEGGGTAYQANYDSDGHVWAWSAAALGALGPATQQFNEGYTFSLENFSQITTTNSLGFTTTASYQYNDSSSKERATAIVTPSQPTGDYFAYDRRGRGIVTGHLLTASQSPAQDGYEYDVQARLISISRLAAKVEDLAYDAASGLVARTFATPIQTASGTETARYYVGDDLTVVKGTQSSATKQVGYVHVRLGSRRIASIWAKSVSAAWTNGVIYYHRDFRGSVVATTTTGGIAGISYRYLPSGALDKTIGTEADETASELGFTGGIRLNGGLIHLRARVYSPLLRRFLQPDTIDLKRYTYANGDPINVVDPTGRSGDSPNNAPGPVGSADWDMLDEKLDQASFSMGGHISIDPGTISSTETTTTWTTKQTGFNEDGSVAWSKIDSNTTVGGSSSINTTSMASSNSASGPNSSTRLAITAAGITGLRGPAAGALGGVVGAAIGKWVFSRLTSHLNIPAVSREAYQQTIAVSTIIGGVGGLAPPNFGAQLIAGVLAGGIGAMATSWITGDPLSQQAGNNALIAGFIGGAVSGGLGGGVVGGFVGGVSAGVVGAGLDAYDAGINAGRYPMEMFQSLMVVH